MKKRGHSNGNSSIPGGGGDDAIKNALNFVMEVKLTFHDQREKYEMFLNVIKDFRDKRIDIAGVMATMKNLFKGHRSLILGFNNFLPKGYEITIDDCDTPVRKTVEYDKVISVVNKIKRRFHNDEHVYESFLDILRMYKNGNKGINEVYREVATLFDDHPDLLDEFKKILPHNFATPSIHHVACDPAFSELSSITMEAEGEMGKVLEKAQQGPRRECILQSLLACIGLSNFCWYRTFIAGKALFKTLMLSAGKGSDTIESVFAKIHWSEL
ncbi:paired amphipathic helix protein Sin3-like 2 isoform X2 [Ziziphus jujuba]|uniref:Paired amphipathic helix protein Sin3-like 2 isoform X2 n=1 Tax=Ziziphus jujuba TaxID=326968 RepID=A0ABM3IGF9_ZIZJJ|nr:paired amphipathic helix protein Sin3-like 2 isoform X2 [Ziziphus jujuba]